MREEREGGNERWLEESGKEREQGSKGEYYICGLLMCVKMFHIFY